MCVALTVLSACDADPHALRPSRVATPQFDGEYALIPEQSFADLRAWVAAEPDAERRKGRGVLLGLALDLHDNLTIRRGVLRSGAVLVQEFSLKSARLDGDTLTGVAVWHEDIEDPGDASDIGIRLTRRGDLLELVLIGEDGGSEDIISYRRVK